MTSKTLVIFSGGQDSTTCLGWALDQYAEVRCLSFDYGQKHRIELEAAEAVISFFVEKTGRSIPHEILKLGDDFFTGTSPLTDPTAELETYTDHDQMEEIIGDRIEKTFVPMRNATFLMIAANRAVVHGCNSIVTGVCQADNANYPDCRQDFVWATQDAINYALGREDDLERKLLIMTPLMNLSKAQSITLAQALPHTYDALAWSHTAYDGNYPPTGKDHASILRAHGFEQAGVPDPLVVRAWREGRMELPKTENYNRLIV